MSHIVSIKTIVTDKGAMEAACKELGLTLSPTKTFKGWAGREYPCDARITVPGSAWDIGLVPKPDGKGWELQCDHFLFADQRVGKDCQRLVQLYAVHKASREAQMRGMAVAREQMANGTIRLQIVGRSM